MKKPNKFLSFFTKYPVIISLVLLIPTTASFFSAMSGAFDFHYNYLYEGESLDIDDETFELTGIKKVGNVTQLSSNFSYQGGACYQNYYAVCCDAFESILIYDTTNMKLVNTVNTGYNMPTWHCNQIFFGKDFYSSRDKFPLLYVSMEHETVHSIMVFRLMKLGDAYYAKEVQQLELYFEDEQDTVYFPNAYYDYDEEYIYYGGYTEKSYMKSDSNKLKFYTFNLPDYRLEYFTLDTAESLDTFELPSETATQGGFISHSHLYQTFSFGSETDPLKTPKMRVVDLKEHKIIKDYQNLGKDFGVYEEFEHVAINYDGKMYSLGNPFNIYEFEFKADE